MLVRFLLGDRRRLVAGAADEAQHLGHVAHQVPGVLVHFHLHQHVAGVELALALALLAVAHLDHFFGRHQDLAELGFQAVALDAILQRLGHPMLEVRIGVHHIPAQCHAVQPPCPVSSSSPRPATDRAPRRTGPRSPRSRTPPRVVVMRLLPARPDHLAQLDARIEHETPEAPAVLDQANTAMPSTRPASIASQRCAGCDAQHVIAGDTGDHQRDRRRHLGLSTPESAACS